MIDDVSLKILKILQKKARIPNVEVARQVGMAPSAVLERIRKLEKQGFIDGYEVRLNPKRFAKSLVAFVNVKLKKLDAEIKVGQTLSKLPAVQEVHYVAGEDAFLVKVRAADTEALSGLIRDKIAAIAGVQSTQTAIVLSTYKETARIPIES
ncbi:MAG: Lrp/AsnC family transcriptional regulator [Desulfobacterales bacterium]|nr:Lrp/AsnC family transcriptional regulator [Desulfobacterales bacterium]